MKLSRGTLTNAFVRFRTLLYAFACQGFRSTETLDKAKGAYHHLPVELSFETPNYKVQTGRFKDKILGLKTLDTVKRDFPSAFLLTRKIESLE